MYRYGFWAVVFFALGPLAAAQEKEQPKPGSYERALKHGEKTRTYRIHLPPSYDGSKAVPLVLAFHGGGERGNALTAERGLGFNPLSDKHGFLVVYPEGIEHHWNDGRKSPRFPKELHDDVGFVRELIGHLTKTYKIDPNRIYATGNSNGGFMTQRLGWELSDLLAAIAPSAGTLAEDLPPQFAPKHPVHVLHIHGTKDPAVPFDGGEVIGRGGKCISVAKMIELWVKANGCTDKPTVEYRPEKEPKDGTKVRRESYAAGGKKAEVVLLAVEGHGHNWPGRPSMNTMAGPNSNQLNAAEVVWDFFEKHPKVPADPKKDTKADDADRPRLNWKTPPIKADRVQYQTFESTAAKTTISYHVYTPEAYDQEKDRRFPVLYWLHGSGGGLAGIKPLSEFFDEAIRTEKIPPMLIVFPNGLASSMWCDSKDGRVPMETVVVKELVPHVDKTFRTMASRGGRMIEGFSMGGYGAGRLGFLYPDTFGTVSVLAGGPLDLDFQGPRAKGNPAERERILKDTFGGDPDHYKAQSPLTVAEKQAAVVAGKSKVRVAVGARDFTADLNRAYSEHLKKLKIEHEWTVVPGVAHETLPLLKGLGEANWNFYRAAFRKK